MSLSQAIPFALARYDGGMKRPRLYRAARIAATVACLSPCLLMIGLWARSNQSPTYIREHLPGVPGLEITSDRSELHVAHLALDKPMRKLGGVLYQPQYWSFHLSFKFLIPLTAALALIPWLPWQRLRFSLRTLLVVTTLIAVMLAVMVAR
jgi:hypothetical protein